MLRALLLVFVVTALPLHAQRVQVFWQSLLSNTHQQSTGAPLTSEFYFEVGGFKNGFIPTSSNTSQWTANWASVGRAQFDATNQRFAKTATLITNADPFRTNQPVYIWGYKATTGPSEWILLTRPIANWAWPDVDNPFIPTSPSYSLNPIVTNITAIIGTFNQAGVVMKTAAVSNSPIPALTYAAWVAANFTAAEQNNPLISGQNADPDNDRLTNLHEYAIASPPKQVSVDTALEIDLVPVDDEKNPVAYIQLSPAALVNVTLLESNNLQNFLPLNPAPELIEDFNGGIILRDPSAISTTGPRNFYRLAIRPNP